MEEKIRIPVLLGVLVVCCAMIAPAGSVVAGQEEAGNETTTEVVEGVTETATDPEPSDETASSTETVAESETAEESAEDTETETETDAPTATETQAETTTHTPTATETASSTETPTDTETTTEPSTSSETQTSTETRGNSETETETETEVDASENVTTSTDSAEANETDSTEEVTTGTRNATSEGDEATDETANGTVAVDESATNETSDAANSTGQIDDTIDENASADEPANDSGDSAGETEDGVEASTDASDDEVENTSESVTAAARSATAEPTESETNATQEVTNTSREVTNGSVESSDDATQSVSADTVESANDTSGSTADGIAETANETNRSAAEDSVESVSDAAQEVTNETGATANDTAASAADSTAEVLNRSNRSTGALVETVNDTLRSATEGSVEAYNGTTQAVADDHVESIDDATGAVTDGTAETATDLALNATERTDGFEANRTGSEVELEGVLSTAEEAAEEAETQVVGTTQNGTGDGVELTNATLEGVEPRNELSNAIENTTGIVTEDTGDLLGGVTSPVDEDGGTTARVTAVVTKLRTDVIDVTVAGLDDTTKTATDTTVLVTTAMETLDVDHAIDVTVEDTVELTDALHPTVSESVDDLSRTVSHLWQMTRSATVATDDVTDTVDPGFDPIATGDGIVVRPSGVVGPDGAVEHLAGPTGSHPATTDVRAGQPIESGGVRGPTEVGATVTPHVDVGDHRSTVVASGYQPDVEVQDRYEERRGGDSYGDVRLFDGGPLPDEQDEASGPSIDGVSDDPDQRAERGERSNARARNVVGDRDRPSVPAGPLPDHAIPVLLAVIASAGVVALRNGTTIAAPIASTVTSSIGMHVRTVVGGARAWLGRLPRFFPIPGYSRYDDSDPLENEHRARLHETVTTAPGLDLATLVERADVSRSTARYHLRILEHEGVITREEVWGKSRIYPAGTDDVERHAALQSEPTRAVLEAIRRHEPASGTTIATDLERDVSTVSHHLERLDEVGLIERERDGRAVRNRLAPATRESTSLERDGHDASGRALSSDD